MRATRGRWAHRGVLALGVVVSSLIVPGATRATAQPTDVQAFMTLYGWADNSPPGPGIAHPTCLHASAGGTGTYADPVTFATDVSESPWCQIIYVPYMQRYFIHEDECTECDRDWTNLHLYRFDMWAGGDQNSRHRPERRALLRCESTWTRAGSVTDPANPTVVVDPPPTLTVTTAPIFSPVSGCWPGPIALTDPGRLTSTVGQVVDLQLQATDSDAGQTPSFSATGLPPGLSLDAASGLVSGTLTDPGRRKVTVTAADSTTSASATFVWQVRRH